MPKSQKVQRMLALLSLLQSGGHYNARQLAEHCRVHRRTIFRDLATLQESGVHVHYDDEKEAYWLPHQTLLPPTALTLDEVLSLLVVCQSLGAAQGVPFTHPASSAAAKLASSLPASLRQNLDLAVASTRIRMDAHNPLAGAQKWFDVLVTSLNGRKCVRATYQEPLKPQPLVTKISPYELFFSKRSWYVIGRSSLHRAVRTFNLGRFVDLILLDEKAVIPPRFSLARYLGNAWQMIRKPPRAEVVIDFKRTVAQNVKEVLWHKTQKTVDRGGGAIRFTATVDGFDEISWWILGYGDEAEVISPPELRKLVARRARNVVKTYRRKRRSGELPDESGCP